MSACILNMGGNMIFDTRRKVSNFAIMDRWAFDPARVSFELVHGTKTRVCKQCVLCASVHYKPWIPAAIAVSKKVKERWVQHAYHMLVVFWYNNNRMEVHQSATEDARR